MILVGFIIAQIIIFAVTLFILKRLIFQDTDSAINRLTKLDSINRDKEKKLGDKLEETDRLLREKMQQLQEEERRMKLEAERAANQMHDDIVKKAREEGEDILQKAFNSRDKIRSEAMIEAESRVIDLCAEMIKQVVGPLAAKSLNEALFEEFLTDLQASDMGVVSSVKRIELHSAFKLEEALIAKVQAIVDEKIGKKLEIKVKEDAGLIAGVMMKFGTMIVDDSMRERLGLAVKKLKDDLAWKHRTK